MLKIKENTNLQSGKLSRSAKLFLALLLIMGAAIRIWIAFQPVENLCYKIIPDDAFYYFQTARHIVAGNGSTFDGVEPHNGYHPAWMGMILPIFALVNDDLSRPGPVSAVRGAMILGALLDVVTAFLMFIIGLRLTGSTALGILACALHLFDPYAIFYSVDGLETSLLCVMIASVLVISQKPLSGTTISARRAMYLGVLLGFLMLSRTDSVFFAGSLLLVLIFVSRQKLDTFRKLLVTGTIASMIVIPWLIWGRLYVGTWGQTSASAAPYELHLAFIRLHGAMEMSFFLEVTVKMLTNGAKLALTLSPLGYALLPLLFTVVFLVLFSKVNTKGLSFFIAPAVYCFFLLLVHAGWRWMPRSWYYAPLYVFECLLIPVIIGLLLGQLKMSKSAISWVVAIGITIVFGVDGYRTWKVGLWPGQKEALIGTRWVRRDLPADVKVGSTDAGIFSYFGPSGVVNLDGVVNESARRAIREGRLLEYCMNKGLQFIGVREFLSHTEVMGKRYQLYLYPDRTGLFEIRPDPWGEPKRFEATDGVIDLGEQSAERYLLAGWSVPERHLNPSLVWAVAEKAEAAVTIPVGATRIEIIVQPFKPPEFKGLKMEITLDDVVIASHDLIPGWQKIVVAVSEEAADGRIHILGFNFDPPPRLTPSDLNMWRDRRTLAASFDKILIISE